MFLSCAQNGQILFWEQRSPIERDLVWLDSIIARVARHSARIVCLAGKLRTLVEPHISFIRSSLGNPHFKWAHHSYKPGSLSSILDQYPCRRRWGWAGGVTTAGNWRLALVCQHCCRLCLRLDFVFGAKNTTARRRKENSSTADERRLNTDLPNWRLQINREWTRIDANKSLVSKIELTNAALNHRAKGGP